MSLRARLPDLSPRHLELSRCIAGAELILTELMKGKEDLRQMVLYIISKTYKQNVLYKCKEIRKRLKDNRIC